MKLAGLVSAIVVVTIASLTFGAGAAVGAITGTQGTISGTITDPGGNPIAGIDVGAFGWADYRTQLPTSWARTDSLGRYSIVDVTPTDYVVTAEDNREVRGGQFSSRSWEIDSLANSLGDYLHISAGENRTSVNMVLHHGGIISGAVKCAGCQGPGSSPQTALIWQWLDARTQRWTDYPTPTQLGANSSFSARNLIPGRYRLTVKVAGFVTSTTPPIDVAEGQMLSGQNVNMVPRVAGFPRPGQLVKTAASATVYLANGDSAVPLRTLSSASDLGLPVIVTVISQAIFNAFTTARVPLSNLVTCGSSTLLGAEDQLWQIAADVAGSLPTALDDSVCARLIGSGNNLYSGVFVRSLNSATVYQLSGGSKHPLLTPKTVELISGSPSTRILTVNAPFLDSLPTGATIIQPGSLVKSPLSATVYLADGFDSLIPVRFLSTAAAAGIGSTVYIVAALDLAKLRVTSAPLSGVFRCRGLPFIAGSSRIWQTTETLVAGLAVSTLQATTCSVLPVGANRLGFAILATAAPSPIVYLIDRSGRKRAVVGGVSLAALSTPDAPIVIAVGPEFLASLTTGVEIRTSGTVKNPLSSIIPPLVNDPHSSIIRPRQ